MKVQLVITKLMKIKKISFLNSSMKLNKIVSKVTTHITSNCVTAQQKEQYKYAFLFPFILDKYVFSNMPVVDDSNGLLLNYIIGIATLQIFILIGFTNIIMNILVLYLLSNDNLTVLNVVKEKYPKFIKVINYFAKASK